MKRNIFEIQDTFWKPIVERICRETIPYQYDVLNDNIEGIPESHAVENFKIAAGLKEGEFQGMLFQDSDVAKWIEAAAYALRIFPDPELEEKIDGLIAVMEKAQKPDGYLNSYYSRYGEEIRFQNIAHGHELYCAGHLLEAAVAYAESTGKEKFLHMMERYMDYLCSIIGPEEGKLHIYPGHPEIELALYKLYQYTQEKRYFHLMEYFLTERGKQPSVLLYAPDFGERYKDKWFSLAYHQAHQPVLEQEKACGHAVRAMYLYCGMADLLWETGDRALFKCLRKLWDDVTKHKMYITGAIGSEQHGECFSAAYDLPNDRAYGETCASIGLFLWSARMLKYDKDAEYADIMEKLMYNSIISGISEDGKRYFYVNPLEAVPELVEERYDLQHVKTERVEWLGCACCPPNIARFLTSMSEYSCSVEKNTVYIYQYIAGKLFLSEDRSSFFEISGNYIFTGRLTYVYHGEKSGKKIYFRIPEWCREWEILVFGEGKSYSREGSRLKKGFCEIETTLKEGDRIDVIFCMEVRFLYANPHIYADAGLCAVMRGPVVYCFEETDNGKMLHSIRIHTDADTKITEGESMERSGILLEADKEETEGWDGLLYRENRMGYTDMQIKAIPYFFWGNRKKGEMRVWMRYR